MKEHDLIHGLMEIFQCKEEYHLQTTKLLAQDLHVLERLYDVEPVQVLELAGLYHLAPSTLTGILDRLAKKGLVRRERGEVNRKIVEIRLTGEGRKMVQMHFFEDERFTRNFFAALPAEKQGEFKELLGELLKNLEVQKLFDE